MKQAVQHLFNKIFEPTCPICLKQYEEDNLPTIMCPNQHTGCQDCMKLYENTKIKCAVIGCTKEIYSFKKPPIQAFKNALKYHQQILEIFQSHQQYYLQKIDLNQESQQQAIQIFIKAQKQFIKQNFQEALALCKECIRIKPNQWPNFKFLGHPRQFWLCNSLAYVQCYQNHLDNSEQRSVYDLLNLCLAISSQFEENEQWLLQQFHKRIVATQLTMGLGIFYYAHGQRSKSEYYLYLTCKFSQVLQNQISALLFSDFNRKQFWHTSQDIDLPKQIICIKFVNNLNSCKMCYQQQNQYRIQFIEKKQYFQYQVNLQYLQKFKIFKNLNKLFYPAYYIMGKIYLSLGDYQQAIKHLQIYSRYVKASTVNDDKTKILLAFAFAMLPNCQAYKLAIGIDYVNAYISKNIKHNHLNLNLYWLLAKLYKQLKDLPSCKVYLQRYQTLKMNNVSVFNSDYPQAQKEKQQKSKYELLKAQVYNLQNNFEQAIVHYQNYISMMGSYIDVKEQYTEVLLNNNRLEKAQSIYEKYFFQSAKILFKFGQRYSQRKQDLQAVDFFIKSFNIDSKYQQNTQVLAYICLILENAQRYQEALYWTQKWSEIQPTSTKVMRTLGSLYLKMAESKEAQGKPRKIIHTGILL